MAEEKDVKNINQKPEELSENDLQQVVGGSGVSNSDFLKLDYKE